MSCKPEPLPLDYDRVKVPEQDKSGCATLVSYTQEISLAHFQGHWRSGCFVTSQVAVCVCVCVCMNAKNTLSIISVMKINEVDTSAAESPQMNQ